MSLPEISRRCLSCGAAVRAGSRFCPQCGKGLEAEVAPGAPEEHASVPPTGEWSRPAEATPQAKDLTPPTKEVTAFEQSPVVAKAPPAPVAQTPAAAADVREVVEPEPSVVVAPESQAEASAASEETGRAADLRGRVARVREGTRARVGRMREEAIVVLEETPDDSGLRFVLAAAALFVLFLVLLFLSTTIMR